MAERRKFSVGDRVGIAFGQVLTEIGENGESVALFYFQPGRNGTVEKVENAGTVIVRLDACGSSGSTRVRILPINLTRLNWLRS